MPTGSRKTGSMHKRRLTASLIVFSHFVLLVAAVYIYGCSRDSRIEATTETLEIQSLSEEKTNPLAGCLQCHVDVEAEHLSSAHHRVLKIGCIDCHGPSKGHVADENNEVEPEETFARKDVDGSCGRCHKCSRETTARETKTQPGTRKVCTECHAAHIFSRARVKERTVP